MGFLVIDPHGAALYRRIDQRIVDLAGRLTFDVDDGRLLCDPTTGWPAYVLSGHLWWPIDQSRKPLLHLNLPDLWPDADDADKIERALNSIEG
jgi:hypothetical protein